jgi:hypothetical protein
MNLQLNAIEFEKQEDTGVMDKRKNQEFIEMQRDRQ